MPPAVRSRLPLIPVTLTVAILAAQLVPAAPLTDPAGAALPSDLQLRVPPLYLVFGPLFTLWDGVSMLSMRRLYGLLVGLAVLYVVARAALAIARRCARKAPTRWWRRVGREVLILGLALVAFVTFVAVGALWHRPMLALAGVPADRIVTDFHSHSNASHDVDDDWLRTLDAASTRRWHARAGFDATFLTDHNTVANLPPAGTPQPAPAICPGTEVSAWRAHIVLLGTRDSVHRSRYNGSLDELLTLIRASEARYGARSVASIPEYERYHRDRLDTLIAAGLDGFEVVNAAPKANEISIARRDSVIALARAADRFVVGVSDQHGWGATSMAWNLVAAPGWRADSARVCDAVLGALDAGFEAVQVVERHRVRPDAWWPLWLTPVAVVWESWRAMGWALVLSWLAWIWVAHWGARRRRPGD